MQNNKDSKVGLDLGLDLGKGYKLFFTILSQISFKKVSKSISVLTSLGRDRKIKLVAKFFDPYLLK